MRIEIPDNWVWCRLNDIVSKEIRRGKSPKYDEAGSAFAFAQKCNSKYDGIIVNTNNTFENRIKNSISVEHEVAEKGVLLYGY